MGRGLPLEERGGHMYLLTPLPFHCVSCLQVKPSAPTQLHSLPAMAFEQRFQGHSFFRVLGAFGAGKSLQALLEGRNEVSRYLKDGRLSPPSSLVLTVFVVFHSQP